METIILYNINNYIGASIIYHSTTRLGGVQQQNCNRLNATWSCIPPTRGVEQYTDWTRREAVHRPNEAWSGTPTERGVEQYTD